MSRAFPSFCALILTAFTVTSSNAADWNWPRWRGPQQDGHTTETGLPVEWNAGDVTWKETMPGRGHSSPVIWGERIFLTTALEEGRQRLVFCVDRNDGRIVWQQTAWNGDPEPSHTMNGWAAPTCVTDGERVYAFFGQGGGLFCYAAADGKQLWNVDLGKFPSPWGTAASPVLVGDLVIQNCDSEGDAFLIGVDKTSGKEVWRTDREDFRGWSTPVLIEAAGRQELVMNGHSGTRAYDPVSGKELWYAEGPDGRGTPTVTPAGGLLHVIEGRKGMYAVKPGGSGTVSTSHVAWRVRRSGRDLPSPIVVNNYLLAMSHRSAILGCYEPATGKELWQERIGGQFSASPIAYQGLAFFHNEAGMTYVVKPGPKPEIVAKNTVDPADDELFRASITPSDGQLILRSDQVLYCIGKRKSTPSK